MRADHQEILVGIEIYEGGDIIVTRNDVSVLNAIR
jgi:hypothetical protein